MNVLKPNLRITVQTLLEQRDRASARSSGVTGVDRKTIRRYASAAEAKSPGVATGSEAARALLRGKIPHPGHRLGAADRPLGLRGAPASGSRRRCGSGATP